MEGYRVWINSMNDFNDMVLMHPDGSLRWCEDAWDGKEEDLEEGACSVEYNSCAKDKHGNPIYAGDIMFGQEEGNGETTAWTDVYYIVSFDKREARWVVREKHEKEDSWGISLEEIMQDYEVVGNIHQNKDLLGK